MRLQDIIDRLKNIKKSDVVIDELDIFIKEMQDMENLTK